MNRTRVDWGKEGNVERVVEFQAKVTIRMEKNGMKKSAELKDGDNVKNRAIRLG